MIRRTMDATFLNGIANDPWVRPWLGGDEGPIDLEPMIESDGFIALEAEHGGFMLQRLDAGVYELHTLFLPRGRAQPAAREMFRWMFTQTDAVEILTKCPDDNRAAGIAAARVGFRERFHRPDAWAPGVGISYRAFTIDDWMMSDGEALDQGRAFHELVEHAKQMAGSDIPIHDDDEAHNRAAGSAVLIWKAGQTPKAVAVYNRWAVFAGYDPIAMVSETVVDIGDAVLELKGDAVEVLLCR